MTDLSTLTVHQLRVLLVLLEEQSVSSSARRLGVTQPAVSHALRALRGSLDDALLVGGTHGMVATPRAAAMLGPLRRTLRELDNLLSGSGALDVGTLRRTFTLATWDGVTVELLPALLRRAATEAPGVAFDVRPVPPEGCTGGLEDGRFDLGVEVRPRATPGLKQRALSDDSFACLVRSDHPGVGSHLDLPTFLALPHALVSPQGEGTSVVDRRLAELGHRRRVVLRIRYFLAAPLVVARTDLVLTLPRRLAAYLASLAPVRLLEPPVELPTFRTFMVWHERSDADPAHQWLRDALAAAAAEPGS